MKMSKKILSVILAVLMAFSTFAVTLSASAAEAAKPEYTEKVTEEDITELLDDANTLLLTKVNWGSLLQSVYKLLPTIRITAMGLELGIYGSNQTAFYNGTITISQLRKDRTASEHNKEFFKDLDEYDDENGYIINDQKEEKDEATGEVTQEFVPGTFTKFFEKHPIVIESAKDLKDELNNLIDTIIDRIMLFAYIDMLGPGAVTRIDKGFDTLVEALGINMPYKASEVKELVSTPTQTEKGIAIAKALVDWLLPTQEDGTVVSNIPNDVVGIIQALFDEEKGAKIYEALDNIFDGLNRIGKGLGPFGMQNVADILTGIYTTFKSIPTTNSGTDADEKEINKRFDIEALIPFALGLVSKDIADNIDVRFNKDEFDASYDDAGYSPENGKTITLLLKPLADDLAKVAAAESPADAVKFVVDYLYDAVLMNKYNNNIVYSVFDGLADSFITIPDNIKEIGKDIVDPADDVDNVPKAEDELLTMALSLVGEMVDHHINLQAVEAKDATCTEEGIAQACFYCPDCKNYFATDDEYQSEALNIEEVIIAPTGHEFGEVVAAKAPTYFEEGNVEYKPCTKCEKNFAPDAETTAADEDAIDVTVAKVEGTLGNISKDEVLDTLDLLMLQKHLVDLEDFDYVQLALADVNGDGIVDPQDLLAIKQFLVGKIKGFDEVQKVNQ